MGLDVYFNQLVYQQNKKYYKQWFFHKWKIKLKVYKSKKYSGVCFAFLAMIHIDMHSQKFIIFSFQLSHFFFQDASAFSITILSHPLNAASSFSLRAKELLKASFALNVFSKCIDLM